MKPFVITDPKKAHVDILRKAHNPAVMKPAPMPRRNENAVEAYATRTT